MWGWVRGVGGVACEVGVGEGFEGEVAASSVTKIQRGSKVLQKNSGEAKCYKKTAG